MYDKFDKVCASGQVFFPARLYLAYSRNPRNFQEIFWRFYDRSHQMTNHLFYLSLTPGDSKWQYLVSQRVVQVVEFGPRSKESNFLALFGLVEGTLGIGILKCKNDTQAENGVHTVDAVNIGGRTPHSELDPCMMQ